MDRQDLKIGDYLNLTGCFTEEYFIRGMSVYQIGVELGLPLQRLKNGVYVSFAIELPTIHGFKLGGWTEFPTQLFMESRKGKMEWNETKFEETYDGKRMPISIEKAKRGWLNNMKQEKLVKVLPIDRYEKGDEFPSGGKASQIIVVHPLRCQVTNFLKYDEIFRGVWN